tara:strand:- start:6254 stop:6502 length:249 start_codon:yes stop_codon:yes gene_type:complete
MNRRNRGYTIFELITIVWFCVILFAIASWFKNIYHLSQLDFEAPYKAEVIRGIGIPVFFVPTITSWMDIGEENKPEPLDIGE